MKQIIIGYSGHAYVAIDAAHSAGINFTAYCDMAEKSVDPYDLVFLGMESEEILQDSRWFVGIGNNALRKKIYQTFKDVGECLIVISNSAVVSKTAQIGTGSLIAPNATINAFARIGICAIVNTSAIVEHECVIGDYTHIAPGAVLAGNVKIGPECFIGANAVIKEGVSIGSNVIVGAGSVILQDIPEGKTVVGNPGKLIHK